MPDINGWHIDGQFDSDTTIEILDENAFQVCEIGPFDGDWTPEEIQRAHLIEASPNLLKACKIVSACFDALEAAIAADDPLREKIMRRHAPLRAVLDPAIAQAERTS